MTMRLIVFASILAFALAAEALSATAAWCADTRGALTPEMQAALETHESCLQGSDCNELGHTNFSLPLREVYTPPKHWQRMVRTPLPLAQAMETAFGNFDPRRRLSVHWLDEKQVDKSWVLLSGWACAQVLLFLPVIEKGRLSYWLATASCSAETTGGCHACSSLLSVFCFEETEDGWSLSARSVAFARMGDYGQALPVFPVRIGARRVGLWVQGCGMGQGCVYGGAELFARSGQGFQAVFSGAAITDTTGMLPGGGSFTRYRYRFQRVPGQEFHDITARVKMMEWKKYKRITTHAQMRYVYKNGRYELAPQATPVP